MSSNDISGNPNTNTTSNSVGEITPLPSNDFFPPIAEDVWKSFFGDEFPNFTVSSMNRNPRTSPITPSNTPERTDFDGQLLMARQSLFDCNSAVKDLQESQNSFQETWVNTLTWLLSQSNKIKFRIFAKIRETQEFMQSIKVYLQDLERWTREIDSKVVELINMSGDMESGEDSDSA